MFPGFGQGGSGNNNQQNNGNPYPGCEINRMSYGSSNFHNQETIRPDHTGKALDNGKMMGNILMAFIIAVFVHSAWVWYVRSGNANSGNQIERAR